MENIERRVAREAKEMTKRQVMMKAINGEITWLQAADILGVTARHMRRMRRAVEIQGFGELRDGEGTRAVRRRRIPVATIRELCRLKREVYADRGSHFCRTAKVGDAPAGEQHGQVAQALRALGIRQILARSPEARGRSERAFGTIQGRLPQELRLAAITGYEAANRYLEEVF